MCYDTHGEEEYVAFVVSVQSLAGLHVRYYYVDDSNL